MHYAHTFRLDYRTFFSLMVLLDFSSEWYITKNVRLIAGVSNLFDENITLVLF